MIPATIATRKVSTKKATTREIVSAKVSPGATSRCGATGSQPTVAAVPGGGAITGGGGGGAGSAQPTGPVGGVGALQPTGAAEIRPGCAGGAGLTVVGSPGDAGGVGSDGVAGGAGWSVGSSLMRASYATGRDAMGAPGRVGGRPAAPRGPISECAHDVRVTGRRRRPRRRSLHARPRLLQPVRHRLRAWRRVLHEVLQPPFGRGHPSAARSRRDGLAGHDGRAPGLRGRV